MNKEYVIFMSIMAILAFMGVHPEGIAVIGVFIVFFYLACLAARPE